MLGRNNSEQEQFVRDHVDDVDGDVDGDVE
jgi:hypothetical protein